MPEELRKQNALIKESSYIKSSSVAKKQAKISQRIQHKFNMNSQLKYLSFVKKLFLNH